MRPILFALVSLLTVAVVSPARAGEEEDKRAENAVRVLKEVMDAPDKAIPQDLLREAHAIAVVPDVIKAGLVIGGRHGNGVIAVKTRDGTWSNPAFVSMTGGSIGFQAGVSSTDVKSSSHKESTTSPWTTTWSPARSRALPSSTPCGTSGSSPPMTLSQNAFCQSANCGATTPIGPPAITKCENLSFMPWLAIQAWLEVVKRGSMQLTSIAS